MTVFPSNVDTFLPPLVDDITVVQSHHILDLREAIIELEKAIIGNTTLSYDGTLIIEDGYNVIKSLKTLDNHLSVIESQLGIVIDENLDGYVDGYAGRIDILESNLTHHRTESYQIDEDGYSVHGVDGYVVGTLNSQDLINKKVDSGTNYVGPKFIARTSLADVGLDQIQVIGTSGDIVFKANYRGDGYFAGDLIVEGNRIIKGTDIVQNSLTVEGSTILGDNSLDTTTIKGPTTIESNLIVEEITASGSNITLGNTTGTLELNFNEVNILGDGYWNGSIEVDGDVTLGEFSGSTILLRGQINHIGNMENSGSLRALGSKFKVENNQVTIDTDSTIINCNTTIDEGGYYNMSPETPSYKYKKRSASLIVKIIKAAESFDETGETKKAEQLDKIASKQIKKLEEN